MHPHDLVKYVIKPTLDGLSATTPNHRDRFNSSSAIRLLLATAAHESNCGDRVQQVQGPALGIYQIEESTISDLYHNFLVHKQDLLPAFYRYQISGLGAPFQLRTNHAFATAVARLQYFRFPKALPEYRDKEGMWEYYKQYWNTPKGKATKDQFYYAWTRFGIEEFT